VGKLLALIAIVMSVVVGLVVLVAVAAGSGPDGPTSASEGAASLGGPGSGGAQPAPSIPTTWLPLYQQAAATCPGLSWSIVAAVGTVESGSGRSSAPGVWSGANSAGAEGPMQFEPTNSCKRHPEDRAKRAVDVTEGQDRMIL